MKQSGCQVHPIPSSQGVELEELSGPVQAKPLHEYQREGAEHLRDRSTTSTGASSQEKGV